MIIGLMLFLGILGFILWGVSACVYDHEIVWFVIGTILVIASLGVFIFRMFSWIYKSSKDRRNTSRCYNCC